MSTTSGPVTDTTPPHAIFVLPPLTPPRMGALTLLVLTDGNTRSSSGGGYAAGARRVVSLAEHLARRPDVAVLVACILSPDNVAKRGASFFAALYKEFVELGAAIESQRILLASNIRLELHGSLGPLRARGGRAVNLADAIEAVVNMTVGVRAPDLRLVLGVGYGPDAALELGVDIVLRTGMEEPNVLRLSGLSTGDGVAHCAITTPWPDVEPREVDEVIDLYKCGAAPRLARGYEVPAIVDLACALAGEELDTPVRVTLPTSAAPTAVTAALACLYEGPLRGSARLTVEYVGDELATPAHYGPERGAWHHLRIVGGSGAACAKGVGELASVLAPGQAPPLFDLPGGLPLGHANVHACASTAQGLMAGIRAALRFSAAHPPLLGCDRANGCAALPCVPKRVTEGRRDNSERDELGHRFTEKTLAWAEAAGLMLPDAAWRTAAANYALTAFFIHFRVPTEWDEEGTRWEERADLIARYMLLVAAGDEGIFDRVVEGETPTRRWARLERSSRFLRSVLSDETARAPLPDGPDTALLATISHQWQELFEQHRRSCHPAAAASFRTGLESLYAASLAEHRPGIASASFGGEPMSSSAIEDRLSAMPLSIAARVRALVGNALEGEPAAASELRVLLYLAEAGSAIGAGLLFRAAALAAPAQAVSGRAVALLDGAATLLDYHVRLSNDLSGFLDAPGGDRDPKENACTILVSPSFSGAERAAATVRSLVTCRRLAARLGGEIEGGIREVAAAWPSMGVVLRRGTFVGRRVYEVGHYSTISDAQISAIFDEAEKALR